VRYLAIDPGEKRSGLAVGDVETGQAGPVGVLTTGDAEELMRGIEGAIEEHGPDALVVGIPYNMDDTEGPAAKRAQRLAERLERRTGLTVHRFDERLSSFEADERMKQTGLTRKQKKARRDALAAAAILQDFLAQQRSNP
jgi:putative Holliday junction resolvase